VTQLWTRTGNLTELENIGYHFEKHVLKEKQWVNDASPITDVVTYVKRARAFVASPPPGYGVVLVPAQGGGGIIDRMVMNYDTGELGIIVENGPQARAMRTLFNKDSLTTPAARKAWLLSRPGATIVQAGK
jgi:hypothetical protein